MKKLLAIAAVSIICLSAPAQANEKNIDGWAKRATEYFFPKIDTDKNGMISKSEHQAFADNMFKDADTNGDEMISRDEMMAMKKKEKMEMRAAMNQGAGNSSPEQ